jgi:predicted Zn finger-like uncharacterized protein
VILTCPACQTRYLVPDSAIGAMGRQVRCAACRHSWFQEAEPDAPSGRPLPPTLTEPPAAPPVADAAPLPAAEPAIDPFAHQPPFRARRNPARMWTAVAVAAAIVMVAAIAALLAFGLPGRAAGSGSPLVITVLRKPEHQPLASGVDLYTIAGRIRNPTGVSQRVPDIRAELKDSAGRTVYGWTIAAPVARLAPGSRAEFNAAEANVPRTAKTLKLSFASGPGA